MRDLDWKERIGAETTHRSPERQKAKAKEKHDNAAIAACADIPHPEGIPGAVEALRRVARSCGWVETVDRMTVEEQRATLEQALRDMGIEP